MLQERRLLDRADLMDTTSRRIAVAPAGSTMSFLPEALWISAAAVAVCLAVFAGRTDDGLQRAAAFLSSLNLGAQRLLRAAETMSAPFEVETATQRLAQAVQDLVDDRDRLTAQLAALERRLDDVTGSINRQAETNRQADAASVAAVEAPAPLATVTPPSPWPDLPIPTDAEAIAAMIAPPTDTAMLWPPEEVAPIAPFAGYGADIGSALSLNALHTLWRSLRSAHPQLFKGVQAGVTIRDNPRSNRAELRLVVGPFADEQAAAQLCASFAAFRQPCRRTMFDGRLALQ
jgi:hypothetical protein